MNLQVELAFGGAALSHRCIRSKEAASTYLGLSRLNIRVYMYILSTCFGIFGSQVGLGPPRFR